MTQEQWNVLRLYNSTFYELGIFYIIDPLLNDITFEQKNEYGSNYIIISIIVVLDIAF